MGVVCAGAKTVSQTAANRCHYGSGIPDFGIVPVLKDTRINSDSGTYSWIKKSVTTEAVVNKNKRANAKLRYT